jgi:PAS domain S-box-containing protein
MVERDTARPLGMLTTLFRKPYRPDEAGLRLSDVFAAHAADLVSSRRAQQKLRDSEEYFRLALDGGGMGTWEWDSETHLIKADAAHQALFGMPAQDRPMPNEAYWKLMDREEGEIGTKRAEDALEQGNDIQLELRVYPADGHVRWIAVRGRPRHGASDSIIGISYDITERKEREKALRQSQERLSAIIDQLPGGVGLFDAEGVAVMRGGPLGRLWDESLPSRDPGALATWRSLDANGRPLSFDEYPGARASRGKRSVPGSTSCIPIPIETSIGTASVRRRFVMTAGQSSGRPFSSRMWTRKSALTSGCGKAAKGSVRRSSLRDLACTP